MGAADIVPGVSGGTIALITGIYEELTTTIKNINLDLFKSFFGSGYKKFWIELNGNFLITLLLGIFTSVILLAQVIVFLLENHEYKLWGFFFGLIVASAVLILKDIQSFSINLAFWVLVGIIVAGAISLSNSTNIPNTDVYVFFTGSIAITAMILPGISGSFTGVTALGATGLAYGGTATTGNYLQMTYSYAGGTTNTPGLQPGSYSDTFSPFVMDFGFLGPTGNSCRNFIANTTYALAWTSVAISAGGKNQFAVYNNSLANDIYYSTDYGNSWTQGTIANGYSYSVAVSSNLSK